MHREDALVARVLAREQVRREIHQREAVAGRPRADEVLLEVGLDFLRAPVGAGRPRDEQAPGDVDHVLGRLVVVACERPLGEVRRHRVRVGDSRRLVHPIAIGGKVGQAAHGLGVADEGHELVPHVGRSADAVRLGEGERQADERVDERELVGDRREAVVLDERERKLPRPAGVTVEKDALPGDEDVVEDGQRLDHLVARGHRPSPRIGIGMKEVRAEELHAGRRDGNSEGDRPVFLSLGERPCGNDDDLVDVRGA